MALEVSYSSDLTPFQIIVMVTSRCLSELALHCPFFFLFTIFIFIVVLFLMMEVALKSDLHSKHHCSSLPCTDLCGGGYVHF